MTKSYVLYTFVLLLVVSSAMETTKSTEMKMEDLSKRFRNKENYSINKHYSKSNNNRKFLQNGDPSGVKTSFFVSDGNEGVPNFDSCGSNYLKSETYTDLNQCITEEGQCTQNHCNYDTSAYYAWVANSTQPYGGDVVSSVWGDYFEGPDNPDCSGEPVATMDAFYPWGECVVYTYSCSDFDSGCYGDYGGCPTKYCYFSYLDTPQ